MIVGHRQGTWEVSGKKSGQGEYACKRQREEEMLAKDRVKDGSWLVIKAAGYLHLS